MKETRKLIPAFRYDTAAVQAWLEDQAAKGDVLIACSCGFGIFSRGEPVDLRFRLEPAGEGPGPDADRLEVCLAAGWEYVCELRAFWVWKCADPSAEEFYTDPQALGSALERLHRRQRPHRIWCVLYTCFLFWDGFHAFWTHPRPLYRWAFSYLPLWHVLVLVGLMGLLLWDAIAGEVSYRRYVRKLRLGLPQPHRRKYAGPWRGACVTAAMILSIAVIVVQQIWWDNADHYRPADRSSVPYIPLSQIDPSYTGTEPAWAKRISNLLTREQWYVMEHLWDARGPRPKESGFTPGVRPSGPPSVSLRYLRTWTPGLAEALVQSILEEYRGISSIKISPLPGEDGAYFGVFDTGGQVLVICAGDRVMEIHYNGDEFLPDHLAEYMVLTERF